jgi:hypothetical protein
MYVPWLDNLSGKPADWHQIRPPSISPDLPFNFANVRTHKDGTFSFDFRLLIYYVHRTHLHILYEEAARVTPNI